MSIKVNGMQQLINQLDKLGKVGDKHGNTALKSAAEVVRAKEVEVAKRTHSKYSEDVGWKELKAYPIKKGRKYGKIVQVGIKGSESSTGANGSRTTYWDRIKGLWFNNYGFVHNRSGTYIAGTNWIQTAYDESVDEAYAKIREEIEKGLDL